MKDPLALLSAEWLAATFDMNVVLIVRHPAAFADSLRRRENKFPFEDLVQQKTLMKTLLHPYRAQLRAMCREEHSIIEQASLLWKCLNHAVLRFQEKHPEWVVVRYRDLARNPRKGYKHLYKKLSLPWAEWIGDSIEKNTSATIGRWKRRLNTNETEFVKECTSHVWKKFYKKKDW